MALTVVNHLIHSFFECVHVLKLVVDDAVVDEFVCNFSPSRSYILIQASFEVKLSLLTMELFLEKL